MSWPSTWSACSSPAKGPRHDHPAGRDRRHPDRGCRLAVRPIEDAVAAIAAGEIVVVVDDEDRENEGDLIMAAERVSAEKVAFFVRHTSGVICTPARWAAPRRAGPPADGRGEHRVACAPRSRISVDYVHGTTTGISAADRAATIRALADPDTQPSDLARPGHVFPLRYRAGRGAEAGRPHRGRRRPGPPGRAHPAGVLCEVVNDDGDHGPAAASWWRSPPSTGCCSSPSPTWFATGARPSASSTPSPAPASRPASATSRPRLRARTRRHRAPRPGEGRW